MPAGLKLGGQVWPRDWKWASAWVGAGGGGGGRVRGAAPLGCKAKAGARWARQRGQQCSASPTARPLGWPHGCAPLLPLTPHTAGRSPGETRAHLVGRAGVHTLPLAHQHQVIEHGPGRAQRARSGLAVRGAGPGGVEWPCWCGGACCACPPAHSNAQGYRRRAGLGARGAPLTAGTTSLKPTNHARYHTTY